MDDQYSRQQWALDMRDDLRTPPLPHDIRPERDTNRPEWDDTEYIPIQLQSDANTLEQDGISYDSRITTQSDSDTLNAPDQDIYHASTTTTSIVKPKKPQSAWTRLSATWWVEGLTIFVSTGFMIGLIAILASFQNRLTTEWTFFISINAVVAIVITAARATLLATVSVCLSQEKWNHFNNRARRLEDLNIIDRASRGPLGSIQMLFSVSWGVATVSAVVMILSLVTDSFVQQVVSFQPGTIYAHQDGSATFGHAVSYNSGLNFDWGSSVHDGIISLDENAATNPDMQSAFFRGIWQTSWPSGVNCTSNCTWDQSYYTIGFSNACADVTKETLDSLQCSNNQTITLPYGNPSPCNMTTPHGLHFLFVPHSGGSAMSINSYGWDSGTDLTEKLDGRNLSRTAFWSWNRKDIDLISMSLGLKPMLRNSTVVECTSSIVVYKYSNISFVSNNLNIGASEKTPLGKISGVTTMRPPECVSNNCFWADELLWWNNTSPEIPHISISATDLSIVARLFRSQAFSGSVGLSSGQPAGSTTAFGNGSLATVTGVLDNIAQSLTDMIREKGAVEVAQGLTSQAVVYVRVQWLWLILPIALQVLGVLALVGVLVGRRQTKDVPLWKGSALAVLYHSVDSDGVLGSRVKDLQELDDLGTMQVMLEKKTDGADP
ncbi:hypothetical protein MKX08_000826 [Trichoderma sp. CBMAI-0020]|nr:hypothetical protein MKX08_000826 [Trichoderma sp. CBMAI-0020]